MKQTRHVEFADSTCRVCRFDVSRLPIRRVVFGGKLRRANEANEANGLWGWEKAVRMFGG
ncbi:MAG: hypothetical protein IJ148_00315 [Bacteroidaceae bacterium]|nr:hypothetical protein [Bacteroidaceae bacterium]